MNVFLAIAVDNLADADSLTEDKEKAEEKEKLKEGEDQDDDDDDGMSGENMRNNVLIKVTVRAVF